MAPMASSRPLGTCVAEYSTVLMATAGHAPNITHPAEVNDAIADFLQEIHG